MSSIWMSTSRYWNTIKYLRFVQIFERLRKLIKTTRVDSSAAPELREVGGHWTRPCCRSKKMIGPRNFAFLNEQGKLLCEEDWNSTSKSKLWLYNLHYFEDLIAELAESRRNWHVAVIDDWIDENPPGRGVGWEPYPTSLRIVNWIKWSLAGNELETKWIHSLAIQVRYLAENLETHLLGNHLFANSKALVFAGLFFEGKEASKWYRLGYALIERELKEQVLSDGGNFELSPMYHGIFLEDLLDLVNIHRTYQKKTALETEPYVAKMMSWLCSMCHPDGGVSHFNDSVAGISPTKDDLMEYAQKLGITINLDHSILVDMPQSGYTRVKMGELFAIVDRAPIGPDFLPGHAHADTLSFELSLFGQRVIVNSGISQYGTSADRVFERGTANHSTVVVDDQDSSEVWGGFRVARRARVQERDSKVVSDSVYLSASHDGYHRLPGKPTHKRDWVFSSTCLEIRDTVYGEGEHKAEIIYPLHPNVKISNSSEQNLEVELLLKKIDIEFAGNGKMLVESSMYYPEFGLSCSNSRVRFIAAGTLPLEVVTKITY